MRSLTVVGIILIILGVILLASNGITYTTTEKILDIGPIQATQERQKTIPVSPIAVAAGVVLVIIGAKPPLVRVAFGLPE